MFLCRTDAIIFGTLPPFVSNEVKKIFHVWLKNPKKYQLNHAKHFFLGDTMNNAG